MNVHGPTYFESIREELREERMRQHLSLRDVAARMGTSFQYLSSLELGQRPNPGIRSLTIWPQALGGELVLSVDFDVYRRCR